MSKHRPLPLVTLFSLFLVLCIVHGSTADLRAQLKPVFIGSVVDSDFLFPIEVTTGDLDGDGDLDLVGANDQLPGEENSSILWWENQLGDGSLWLRQTIDSQFNGARDIQTVDMDGDGDLDVLATGLSADAIRWWENDLDGALWTPRTVVSGLDGAVTVRAGDIDGDGDIDVASGATFAGGIRWFDNLDGNGTSWLQRNVNISYDSPRSITIADVDGDGDNDLLACGELEDRVTWWENIAADGLFWTERTVDTTIGAPNTLRTGDIDRDGDLDFVVSAGLDDTVYLYTNSNGNGLTWARSEIDTTPNLPNSVRVHDMDADGDLDVVGTAALDDLLRWWENLDGVGGSWMNRTIENDVDGASTVAVGDLDGDGLTDLATVSAVSDSLLWWSNGAIHRSASYEQVTIVADLADSAHDVFAADLDNDGDQDLVVASEGDDTVFWYDHQGTDPPTYVERILDNVAGGVTGLWVDDINGDGFLDVATANADDNAVRWFEHSGDSPPIFFRRDLTNAALGAVTVVTSDVDSDGDVDVISGSRADDTIRWFENDGNMPPSFLESTVTTDADSVRTVRVADVNGDGHRDIVSVSFLDNALRWHENNGGSPPTFFDRVVSLGVTGARGVAADDLDGDGDTDLLVAAQIGNSVLWFENNGGSPPLFTQNTIALGILGAISVETADTDDDGDVDVLVAARDEGRVYRFVNDGGSPPSFTEEVVGENASLVQTALPADVDSDGDLDIVSSTLAGFQLGYYENCGGQAGLEVTPTEAGTFGEGGVASILAIEVKHLGRSGDFDLQLQTLSLLFEESPGETLTTIEVNALVDRLEIYRDDDDDGNLDLAFDTLVGQELFVDLDDGILTFDAGAGNPDFNVPAEGSEIFFIAPVLTSDAADQTPNQLRVTHLAAEGGPQPGLLTAGFPTPLSLECGEDVASPIVVAAGYELSAVGTCPGPVQIEITGADPNATVGILAGTTTGSFEKPFAPCEGLLLGLDTPAFITSVTADAAGTVRVTPTLQESQCGLLLQAADLATCRVSNVVELP